MFSGGSTWRSEGRSGECDSGLWIGSPTRTGEMLSFLVPDNNLASVWMTHRRQHRWFTSWLNIHIVWPSMLPPLTIQSIGSDVDQPTPGTVICERVNILGKGTPSDHPGTHIAPSVTILNPQHWLNSRSNVMSSWCNLTAGLWQWPIRLIKVLTFSDC